MVSLRKAQGERNGKETAKLSRKTLVAKGLLLA